MKKRTWFGTPDVDELIARGKLDRAIPELEKRLRKQPESTSQRQRLGDILGRAGRTAEAIAVLAPLVEGFARDGFAAKAIAVVKKIERLDPGRGDTSALLAMVRELAQPSMSVPLISPHLESDTVGVEPFRDDIGDRPLATSSVDARWQDRLETERPDYGWSPVLEGLPPEVFVEVVGRLRLVIKNPGAIICAEGEPAPSLLVLARGYARVYRRSGDCGQRQVMVLEEGRFVGEEALLESAARRPVTVTAASECELLEIDLQDLSMILAANPAVRARLEKTHSRRAWNV